MKMVTLVLVLMLCGTVCRSYAIDCMNVWDEESIAEMIEDDRRYEESLRNGHTHTEDDEADDHDDDDDDDESLVDPNDEDEDKERVHIHGTPHHKSDVAHSPQNQRYKREFPAFERPFDAGRADEDSSDMDVAETHLFRPVFRYKAQYTERRRVRAPNAGDNFAPPRP